ncbi:MAG: hypothetical protein B6I20_02795 [Bacteroidetes bacterium 4572_117]|nr:MAG: hypothetical protein B6I20_02795 [Bacteroidetes bacterium 4572_117]
MRLLLLNILILTTFVAYSQRKVTGTVYCKEGKIKNISGSRKKSIWVLTNQAQKLIDRNTTC